MLPVGLHYIFPHRIVRQIIPLMPIVVMVIQFFRTIPIPDVAPPLTPHRVIAGAECRDYGCCPARSGVFKLWFEGDSFMFFFCRHAAEIEKRGVDVNKAGGLSANLSCW